MGMPVAVFPQGAPPPPPVPKGAQLKPNGQSSSMSRSKSPQPQSFEPPPMGCRPEIKIPANPMAALRKVPPPKLKEVDWNEEFRKERSKSPMPPLSTGAEEPRNTTETQLPEPVRELNVQQSDKVDSPVQSYTSRPAPPKESEHSFRDQNNNFSPTNNYVGNFNQNNNYGGNSSPQQRVFSPFASSPQPNLPKPLSPVKLSQSTYDDNVPIYLRSNQRAASEKPSTPLYDQGQSSPVSSFQRQASLEQAQAPIYMRSPRNVSASPVKQNNQSTFQSNTNDTENYPIYVRSFQKQQPPAASAASTPPTQNTQQPLSTAQSPFVNEPGRQYYQPNRVTSPPSTQSGPENSPQMPPWMRRTNSKEIPEWANHADDYNRTSAPQTSTFTNNSNYTTNNSNAQYGNANANANNGAQKVSLNLNYQQVEIIYSNFHGNL